MNTDIYIYIDICMNAYVNLHIYSICTCMYICVWLGMCPCVWLGFALLFARHCDLHFALLSALLFDSLCDLHFALLFALKFFALFFALSLALRFVLL